MKTNPRVEYSLLHCRHAYPKYRVEQRRAYQFVSLPCARLKGNHWGIMVETGSADNVRDCKGHFLIMSCFTDNCKTGDHNKKRRVVKRRASNEILQESKEALHDIAHIARSLGNRVRFIGPDNEQTWATNDSNTKSTFLLGALVHSPMSVINPIKVYNKLEKVDKWHFAGGSENAGDRCTTLFFWYA